MGAVPEQLGHSHYGAGKGVQVGSGLAPHSAEERGDAEPVQGGLAVGRYDASTIPSVIGFTQSEASAGLQAAGFALGRVAQVVYITCEFIGEVKTQTPAAGTLARLGTAVNVTIGKPGGKCL